VKARYGLCLLFFTNQLEAGVVNIADKLQTEEDFSNPTSAPPLERKSTKPKKKKSELSSIVKDKEQDSTDGLEKTSETFLILPSTQDEQVLPAGGVLPVDPKMGEQSPPPPSWWERWWSGFVEWILAENP
jgi:hypothetical protein